MRSRLLHSLLAAAALVAAAVPTRSAEVDPARFRIPAGDAGLPGEGPIRRYDWFQKLWQDKRTGWARRVTEDRKALVFLGDSITQGWGDNMGGAFPGVKVANRGISGDTTRGVLIRLAEDVLTLDPAGVVLLIGTNDIEEGATPETIASNIRLILESLRKHNPSMPVVVCETFPSSAAMRRPAATIRRLNELVAGVTRDFPQVTRIETWLLFADTAGDAKKAEFPDLLHPNPAGYARWAAALRPVLATLGFTETEPDTFRPEPGFELIFNGRDLTGWGFQTNEFKGMVQSSDGRYVVRNGRLVVTTPPEGRRIQQLWTTREFGADFTLRLEFRATPNADSGVFIRKPQLQCRDYPLAGPYKELKNYRPQDWNRMEVVVRGGKAHCTCNGEVLEAALDVPPTGPIGLEGDRGQMEYRRIRVGP